MPGPYTWKFGKRGHVKSYRKGYYKAKRDWKGTALYNKRVLQKRYGYSKIHIPSYAQIYRARAGRGAPRGMVASGALGKGFRSKSLLVSDIPKAPSGKPMKIYETTRSVNNSYDYKGQSVPPTIHQPLSATGNGIIPGNSYNDRISNKISLKGIQIKGEVGWPNTDVSVNPGTVANGRGQIMMYVIVDTQTNKTLVDVDDFLSGDDTERISNRMENYSTRGRFKILCKKVYNIPRTDLDSNGDVIEASVNVDEYINLEGYPITYEGTSTTGLVGDITKNNVYIIVAPDQYTVGTSAIQKWFLNLQTRVYFTD